MANATRGIFCRACGYDLQALSQNRCPECGRDFDPAERRSYDLKPRRRALRRWAWRVGILATIAVVTVGGMVWSTWRGWDHDRRAYERLAKFGIVRKEVAAMPVMEKLLPERFQYLRTRVWSVCITTKNLKAEDWDTMRKMEYLRDGRFGGLAEGDAVLQRIETLQKLTELNLSGKAINDDNMVHLVESMPQVQRLFLNGENLGDAGIARIAKLPALQWFSLYNSRISDQGLMSLAGVGSLRELILYKTPELTEEGLKAFKAARGDVKVKRVVE